MSAVVAETGEKKINKTFERICLLPPVLPYRAVISRTNCTGHADCHRLDVSKLTTDQPNHPVNSHSTFFAVLHGGVSVLGQICQRRRIVKFFLERFQDPIASNAEDKNVCIAQSGHDRDGTVADRVALGLGFAAAQQSARVRLRAQRFAGCHCSESIVAAYDE